MASSPKPRLYDTILRGPGAVAAATRERRRRELESPVRTWRFSRTLPEARAETMMACHLLKAVEGWTDLGLGRFELRYLRDKQQRAIDAPHAFQAVLELPYVGADCFAQSDPTVVPARTLLSQLL